MIDSHVSEGLVGPFALVQQGLSFEKLGDLVHQCKELGPARYLVHGGCNEVFCIVMYEDSSWRIATTQHELFPSKTAHSIT